MTSSFAARARCRERLELLAGGSADPVDLVEEANRSLKATLGFETVWMGTLDPVTGLVSAHLLRHARSWGSAVPHMLARAIDLDDPLNRALGPPMRSLHSVTGPTLGRSMIWSDCLDPVGIGDLVRIPHGHGRGPLIGWAGYRAADDRPFLADDLELLAQTAPQMTAISRAIASEPPSRAPTAPRDAGLLLLDEALQVVASTAAAAEWLPLFSDHAIAAPWGQLPAAIYSAIARARSLPAGNVPALSPLRLLDGSWAAVDASRVHPMTTQYAVTIRPASADETFSSVCRSLDLSQRESEVSQSVRAGLSTDQIAERLFLSPHTVKVHLKTIFRKAGVTSRAELISLLSGQTAGE